MEREELPSDDVSDAMEQTRTVYYIILVGPLTVRRHNGNIKE
jgi:hypothetical protein